MVKTEEKLIKLEPKVITAKLYEEQEVIVCRHIQVVFPLITQKLKINCYECKISFTIIVTKEWEK